MVSQIKKKKKKSLHPVLFVCFMSCCRWESNIKRTAWPMFL